MDNTPDSPAKTPVGYTTQGGNYWTLITPEIWKVLHAVLHTGSSLNGVLSLINRTGRAVLYLQAQAAWLRMPEDIGTGQSNRSWTCSNAQLHVGRNTIRSK